MKARLMKHPALLCQKFSKMKRVIIPVGIVVLLLSVASCALESGNMRGAFICPPCGSACDNLFFNESGHCPHCGMALIHQDSTQKTSKKNVAILIFAGMEILDFSGPAEVFAAAGEFRVFTVAATKDPIISQGFITMLPEFSIDDCPKPDIIVLPGGNITAPLENPKVIHWVKSSAPELEVALSVCTGAFILEKAGLLAGKKATTFHNAIADLRKKATKTEVLDNVRWVDNGKIITTAGVSAGIDGSLRVVDRLLGREKALSIVRYMEYDKWKPEEGLIVTPNENLLKQ